MNNWAFEKDEESVGVKVRRSGVSKYIGDIG